MDLKEIKKQIKEKYGNQATLAALMGYKRCGFNLALNKDPMDIKFRPMLMFFLSLSKKEIKKRFK